MRLRACAGALLPLTPPVTPPRGRCRRQRCRQEAPGSGRVDGRRRRRYCVAESACIRESRARLRHASAGPQPGYSARARAGREGKRELRRGASPGRRQGESGGLSARGRRLGAPSLARGRYRVRAADARRPSPLPPGRWWPAVTQHPAPRHAQPAAVRCHDTARNQRRRVQHVPRGLPPSNRRNDYPGGDSGPVKGAPSARRFRDGASATLDWTWPRVPRTP
jgi:hypothetical protein